MKAAMIKRDIWDVIFRTTDIDTKMKTTQKGVEQRYHPTRSMSVKPDPVLLTLDGRAVAELLPWPVAPNA